METRLALFIALVFVALVSNTLLLWFLYRALARFADQSARYQRRCYQVIKGIGVALEKAELASGRAAAWSGQVRESVVEASGNVDRIENYLGYGMAKIHFNVDRISNEITGRADRIHEAVSEPLNRTGSVVRGIKAILELLTLGRPDDEGRFPHS